MNAMASAAMEHYANHFSKSRAISDNADLAWIASLMSNPLDRSLCRSRKSGINGLRWIYSQAKQNYRGRVETVRNLNCARDGVTVSIMDQIARLVSCFLLHLDGHPFAATKFSLLVAVLVASMAVSTTQARTVRTVINIAFDSFNAYDVRVFLV